MDQRRRWRRLDLPGVEDFREDGRCFEGEVKVNGPPAWEASYRVLFDDSWATVLAEASVRDAGATRSLAIRRKRSGRWFDGDREIETCRGALDVDLELTPSTNTSALRRLALAIGARAEITTTWVHFPELTVEPFRQRYTRLEDRAYLFESLEGDEVVFRARLDLEATGLVERYEGLFERVD
jgi:uncharacterized protein